MLRVLSRNLARGLQQRGPPSAASAASQKAARDARRAEKKAQRAEQVAQKKAAKAGRAGRVVATLTDVGKVTPTGDPLFTNFTAQIKARARIGVIGSNGTGKSSFLKILAGEDSDHLGEVSIPKDIAVGYLSQNPQLDPEATVWSTVESGMSRIVSLKRRFHEICDTLADLEPEARYAETGAPDPAVLSLLSELDTLRADISRTGRDNWILDAKVGIAMDALRCPDPSRLVGTLSGGERRRVDLARTLLSKPDLLLLDEPTNHLDPQSVSWLEEYLRRYDGTVVLVTHDRYFLDRVATWTLECGAEAPGGGRGKVFRAFHGNYSAWLEARENERVAAARAEDRRSKAMKSELEWVRGRGGGTAGRALKDRVSRRVERYEDMVKESRSRRVDPGRIVIPPGPSLAQQVISLKDLSLSVPSESQESQESPDPSSADAPPARVVAASTPAARIDAATGRRILVEGLSVDIPRGAIVGITGPNGAGKSTLFSALLGNTEPDSGKVTVGDTVTFGHVAQHSQDVLHDDQTAFQAIAGGRESIDLGNGRSITSRAFLALFNFRGASQDKAVGTLSGGERNRLLLAKTLTSGCNVLLLDEPTNDLDVDTLRSLEEALPDFEGTALVISHDRYFLDRTATHILHFEGDGTAEWFEGNWAQYEIDRRRRGKVSKYLSDEDVFRQISFGN